MNATENISKTKAAVVCEKVVYINIYTLKYTLLSESDGENASFSIRCIQSQGKYDICLATAPAFTTDETRARGVFESLCRLGVFPVVLRDAVEKLLA